MKMTDSSSSGDPLLGMNTYKFVRLRVTWRLLGWGLNIFVKNYLNEKKTFNFEIKYKKSC